MYFAVFDSSITDILLGRNLMKFFQNTRINLFHEKKFSPICKGLIHERTKIILHDFTAIKYIPT